MKTMFSKKISLLIIIFIIIAIIIASISLATIITPPANKWMYTKTQINILQNLGFDGTGIKIGVIDTGVDITHQEFDTNTFIAWKDCINNHTTYYDDSDQGTHILGLLVAKSSYHGLFSGVNLKGIAPNAQIVIVKAIPKNQFLFGGGNDTSIATAIHFCITQEVDIILLSMGISPEKTTFQTTLKTTAAINQATQQGIFVITPAGNDGENDDGDVAFPGTMEHVICVGSISKDFIISPFSSKGHQYQTTQNPNKKPELVAPGNQLISTRTNNAYGQYSGTAQAATVVTGILALLLDAYPEYKPLGEKNQNETTIKLFKTILAQTAQKIGTLDDTNEQFSHDDFYGYGLIQAYETYKELGKY